MERNPELFRRAELVQDKYTYKRYDLQGFFRGWLTAEDLLLGALCDLQRCPGVLRLPLLLEFGIDLILCRCLERRLDSIHSGNAYGKIRSRPRIIRYGYADEQQ